MLSRRVIDVREAVTNAWRETLEAEPLDFDENFFHSGGNSILLVELQNRISRNLGRAVSLREIWENPTVNGIHARIGDRTAAPSATSGERKEGPLVLYCLPYAGCSARIYEPWKERLPASIIVQPLELPGRGSRCVEPPISALSTLLEDLRGQIDASPPGPYAIFGHSFGAIIAYELALHMDSAASNGPSAIVVSGSKAPHEATPVRSIHDRPDVEFRDGLRRLGGTPKELLENDELMDLYLPAIRADYRILDMYQPSGDGVAVDCDIIALCGIDDTDADEAATADWAMYTGRSFILRQVSGGHFFLHESEAEVLAHLHRELASLP
ncbi:alpha/beta fold hydrolase [Streptomyces hirsutus]|uniref:alpha/beta fold hydrolase n=1 Tax=Streptomyces hirsutus TaxID=35620 RepID=UPI00367E58AD